MAIGETEQKIHFPRNAPAAFAVCWCTAARTIAAPIGLRSIDGRMTFGYLIWSRYLPARLAAGVVPMSGRIPGPLAQKSKILAASDKKSEMYSD
jgi:hypothetical protein